MSANTTSPTVLQRCWLFDAGALAAPELDKLRTASSVRFIYDHLKGDERAQATGPVAAMPSDVVNQIAAKLSNDEQHLWAVNELHFSGTWDALQRHFSNLRYISTADRQRFYLRFADSRSLSALWAVLSMKQQANLMGPIEAWQYFDRDGSPRKLRLSATQKNADAHAARPLAITLSDEQLGRLLDHVWPDQLLSAVLDESPGLAQNAHSAHIYQLSALTCSWLKQVEEDRFPIQKELLASLLSASVMQADVASAHQHLERTHAALLTLQSAN